MPVPILLARLRFGAGLAHGLARRRVLVARKRGFDPAPPLAGGQRAARVGRFA